MNPNKMFSYLHLGVPQDVQRLMIAGDMQGTFAAIDRYLNNPAVPQEMKYALSAQREMLSRLPADYPLNKGQALALVQEKIPDFTQEELDALEQAGRIDWIYLEGEIHYFGRFFETLCKTDAQFARRAGVATGADGQDAGQGLLDQTITQLREKEVLTHRIRCRASVRIEDSVFLPQHSVRAYLPLPCRCEGQDEIKIERVFPENCIITPETSAQRVIYWEEVMQENHEFSVEFSYRKTTKYVDLDAPQPSHNQIFTAQDLSEQAPHILFTPYIRQLVENLSQGATSQLEQARRFYDYITLNVKYTFMRSYFGLENIAENCARNLVGDCGVQALLFITLCRCAGIPARWQSGWNVKPDFCGAHDWAMFFVPTHGWLYADPSFGGGAVRDGNEARRLHYFGNLDPFRMVANTAFYATFDVEKPYWRADPYDNQLGEMEFAQRGLRYNEFQRTKRVLQLTQE